MNEQTIKVEPKCPYFGKCGGCSAQHIAYEVQLNNKITVCNHLFNKFSDKPITIEHDEPYEYRNRMDLIFHPNGLGFRKKGDWKTIIDINQCEISNPKLNQLITEVRENFAGCDVFDMNKKQGIFRFAVIRTPSLTSSITFVLNQDSTKLDEATQEIERFAKSSSAENIIIAYVPANTENTISEEYYVVKGKDTLAEKICDKELHFHSQGFFQNNSVMAEKLVTYVKSLLEKYPTADKHLLDLYGGVGSFGIVCNELFLSTIIVEDYAGSIDLAKKNITINNEPNMSAIVKDAKYLKNVHIPEPFYSITDPPRSGMHPKAIKNLIEREPEVLIYVSCNPKQLAKELIHFTKHYNIESIKIFDLFPQTNHMEVVVEMVRK